MVRGVGHLNKQGCRNASRCVLCLMGAAPASGAPVTLRPVLQALDTATLLAMGDKLAPEEKLLPCVKLRSGKRS